MALSRHQTREISTQFGEREFRSVIDELDTLLDSTGSPPTARKASFEAWFRYHPDVVPMVVCVRRGEDLVAAAVLGRRVRFGLTRFITPGTYGEPSALPALDAEAAAELGREILRQVVATRRPWWLKLNGLPAGDPVAAAISAGAPSLVSSSLVCDQEAAELQFEQPGPLRDHLSSNSHKALAKARNRIADAGLVQELSWHRDAASVEALLPEVIKLHRARNRQLRGHSLLDDPQQEGLFAATVMAHAHDGHVRLLTLRLDGDLAAFAVCFHAGGTLFVYANLVSPDWLRYSAGAVANAEVVRLAHADPDVARLDWGAGLQRYKLAGGAQVRSLFALDCWSPRPLRPVLTALSRFSGGELGGTRR